MEGAPVAPVAPVHWISPSCRNLMARSSMIVTLSLNLARIAWVEAADSLIGSYWILLAHHSSQSTSRLSFPSWSNGNRQRRFSHCLGFLPQQVADHIRSSNSTRNQESVAILGIPSESLSSDLQLLSIADRCLSSKLHKITPIILYSLTSRHCGTVATVGHCGTAPCESPVTSFSSGPRNL